MAKYRMVLSAAIIALLVITGALYFAPLGPWLSVVAKIGALFVSVFALAAIAMFVFTLFPSSDDLSSLWETGYFKYMRAFYGHIWGGFSYDSEPLQIDVCRALKLSAPVIVLWLLFLGTMGLLWYANINFLISDLKSLGALPLDSEASVAMNFLLYDTFGLMAFLITGILTVVSFKIAPINSAPLTVLTVLFWAWLLTAAVGILLAIVVVPIMYYGWFPYFKVVGISLAVGAVIAAAIAAVYLLIRVFAKVSAKMFRSTVPGRLIIEAEKGAKGKFCLIITEKKEERSV